MLNIIFFSVEWLSLFWDHKKKIFKGIQFLKYNFCNQKLTVILKMYFSFIALKCVSTSKKPISS